MSEPNPKRQSSQEFGNLRFGRRNRLGGKRDKECSAAWETENRGRGGPEWLVFGGIATVILLGVGLLVVMWIRNKGSAAGDLADLPVRSKIGLERKAPFDPGAAKDWKGPVPYRIAGSFTKATTNEERLKWVRGPEGVAPLMEGFFREGPGSREKILGITSMGPASNGQVSFQRFQVRMDDGNSRLLCVVLTDEGGKIDFECYARHGSASWKDLLGGQASEADEVRVFIEPGFAFVHGFSDEKKWRGFVATTPDWADPLNFYTLRGSEADRMLVQLATRGSGRATLSIRSVGDSYRKRQFEVTKVLAGGWVR